MNNIDHTYKSKYYDYINAGSIASAEVICPLIIEWLKPLSLIDVGCGAGAWCSVWNSSGIAKVLGIDGEYVQTNSLLIDEKSFIRKDLSIPFRLDQKFDLAVSLEVAEHIPQAKADIFMQNITHCSQRILFSAATPGQGGEFHVNEKPLEYWREKYKELGYRCFDPIRKIIFKNKKVEPWYRYNVLLYVHDSVVDQLPEYIRLTEVPENQPISNYAPFIWRTRNALLRYTPDSIKNKLIAFKHSYIRNKSKR